MAVQEEYPNSLYRREAAFLLGQCYEDMGRKDEALNIFRQLLKGEDKFAVKAKERIEKLEISSSSSRNQ